jgi:hypothetical protein
MAASARSSAASALQDFIHNLRDHAGLLAHMPFDQGTFQEQYEILLAIPKAILFGTLKRNKAVQGGKPLV